MSYFTDAIQYQYADFSGKATRKEYWMYFLCINILYFVVSFIDGLIPSMEDIPILTAIFSLAFFLPSTSIVCRRLHDTGRSGWWQLIVLVPFVGLIVLLVFLVQGSRFETGSSLGLESK